ncbi:hypothetical protein EYF80_016891 [Liparis tanakae]|uniref:Uncharacterized protein n=1 Tax=Liparis tanakae TaxID=230148 RepID=A0A4Z2I6Q0_9TELE|nr:hypothetical protein EYF80_016891 [Liparis tanakae]
MSPSGSRYRCSTEQRNDESLLLRSGADVEKEKIYSWSFFASISSGGEGEEEEEEGGRRGLMTNGGRGAELQVLMVCVMMAVVEAEGEATSCFISGSRCGGGAPLTTGTLSL